jgi:5-(carboxyamino)imidazole ribonucleotide synthase
VHLYGKAETRAHRKMGHVTVLDVDIEHAQEKAERVREVLFITGEESD